MKYVFFSILIFVLNQLVYGQSDGDEIYDGTTMIEIVPEYPGGWERFREFIAVNLNYPEQAKSEGSSGTVYVSFVVERDGRITNIRLIKGIRDDIDFEAIRLMSLVEKMKPGTLRGEVVRYRMIVPIYFKLN
jgi:periplasmic protein TonB